MVLRNIRHLRISVILFKVATLGDIHFQKVNSQLNTEPSVFNICILAKMQIFTKTMPQKMTKEEFQMVLSNATSPK